jgi:hypothetical protein
MAVIFSYAETKSVTYVTLFVFADVTYVTVFFG